MALKLIAIGASTGGVAALLAILSLLPKTSPPILVVQHMPLRFTSILARTMSNAIPNLKISEAVEGDVLTSGRVFIAPAGLHMGLISLNGCLNIKLTDSPKVNHHRPAIDILFQSVAETVGKEALGVILTGMGKDGAEGLLQMYQKGSFTIAQDEKTSVVYGMPKEAVNLGAVSAILPIEEIAFEIISRI